MFIFQFLLAHLLISSLAPAGEEWEKSLDKDDIVIYTRQPETSRFKEFKVEAVMHGSLEKFRAIMSDVENYDRWMPDCKSAVVLRFPHEDDLTYHMRLKVPFPFANRDVVQQLVFRQAGNKMEIRLINKPDDLEKQKKYIRMPVAYGRWLIEQISEDSISIDFQYQADPGGDIPAWLVNAFIVKNPHAMLKNIRKKLAD